MSLTKRELWSSFAAWGDPSVAFNDLGIKEPGPKRAKRERSCPSEWHEQAHLCKLWAEYAPLVRLDVRLLFAVNNGAFLQGNAEDRKIRASMMKSQGMRNGMTDLVLAVPRREYHGLYLEMKALDGTVSPDQRDVHALLAAQGYDVKTGWGAERAFKIITEYLGT